MIPQEYKFEYVPCIFEIPRFSSKWWGNLVFWMISGLVYTGVFLLILNSLNEKVNSFTAIYFVGGIGWLPAILCVLSRAYHKMCTKTYPYLKITPALSASPEALYSNSARKIFGYVLVPRNLAGAAVIWVFMIITVHLNGPSFAQSTANMFINFCYIFVGFVFPSAIFAISNFVLSLYQLSKCAPIELALQKGMIGRLKQNRHIFFILNWSIVFLFGGLSFAMLKSPFGIRLWMWLPVLGFFPLSLFVMSYAVTKNLINQALQQEEESLNCKLLAIKATDTSLVYWLKYWAIVMIQDKYRAYVEDRRSLADWVLFLFTLASAFGSILGAMRSF